MGVLPKVTLFLLLGAAALHQSEGMISWRPASRSWPLFSGFRHSNALQGPSSHGLDLWNDFDDFINMWPTHLVSTHPSHAVQTSTQGGWVKMDDGKDEVQNQFDCEEQHLQLKEDQLRKEWQDLKNRREDHKRQEEQKRRQEQDERLKEKRKLQQQEQVKREEQLRQAKMKEQRKLQELERLKREDQLRQAQMQEQRKLKELERLKREEHLRQAKMQQQRQLQQQEAQRRQEEMRLREERKRLEEQRQLEKERQERIREEEKLNRRRVSEEKAGEVRRRQQEEDERQRQLEEMRRQRARGRESTREETSRHRSRNSNLPKSEIGKLNIPEGYHLEDISIQTIDNQAFVKGHHLCKCYENCYEREFERRLPVPKNVDTRTITAFLYSDGQLTLHGVKYRQVILPVDTDVVVEGVGLTPRTEDDSCSKFSKKKSGFKLKKMNARTGEVFEDVAPLEDTYPRYESEVDNDGLTIEVVE